MRQVVVTGIGAITPLAIGVRTSWKLLLEGKCAIKSLASIANPDAEDYAKLRCGVAGLAPGWPRSKIKWNEATLDRRNEKSTFMDFALQAASEALDDARWSPTSLEDLDRTGVCIGSGIGAFEDICRDVSVFTKKGAKAISPFFVPRILSNMAAGHVSMKYGFKGPSHAVSTACTTGAHSIGDAARFIQCGDANVMVAGGAESCIHPLAIAGFERARSLATGFNDAAQQASRPFDARRQGFVIGEGAAVLVLEELGHALGRGANIYAELASYGTSSDAHHITNPPKSGSGAFQSMRRALKSACIVPREVSYINAHATSTVVGDAAEINAITSLMMGDRGVDRAEGVCVSSTKGAIGHLLGAAGAVEAAFTVLAVNQDIVPPTINLESIDPLFPDFNYVQGLAQRRAVDVALTNSFGFGGTNATLCFRKFRK